MIALPISYLPNIGWESTENQLRGKKNQNTYLDKSLLHWEEYVLQCVIINKSDEIRQGLHKQSKK